MLHDKSWSIKQQVMLRRLELTATAAVFLVRPSFLMPYMVGRTEAVEKAHYLRHWGVPFDALVYVFGRDAMYWYRAELALGRPTIVGSTVKQPQLPRMCSPTRSTPGLWDKRFMLRPRWEAAASSARP